MHRLPAVFGLGAALVVAGAAMAAERTVMLAVKNMDCASCPYIVKKSLTKLPGVGKVAVSFEKKTATVTYDDSKVTVAALTTATTKAGYPSHPIADPAAK